MSVWHAVAAVLLLGWALVLSVVDLRERRLPNALTLGGAVAILLSAVLAGRGESAVLGAAVLGGAYLAVHLVDPRGLGGGDVKLALGLGALTGALGTEVWIPAALGAPVLTAASGLVALLRHGGRSVPHGPSMCAASLLAAAVAVF